MNEEEINKKWSMHDVVQEAIRTAHSNPSPETMRRFELQDKNINKFMEENQKQHVELREDNKEIKEQITKILVSIEGMTEKIFEKADQSYASKTLQTILMWVGGLVVAGLITYLGTLLVKLINI